MDNGDNTDSGGRKPRTQTRPNRSKGFKAFHNSDFPKSQKGPYRPKAKVAQVPILQAVKYLESSLGRMQRQLNGLSNARRPGPHAAALANTPEDAIVTANPGSYDPRWRSYASAARDGSFPADSPLSQVTKLGYELTYAAFDGATEIFTICPLTPDSNATVFARNSNGEFSHVSTVFPKRDIADATSAYFPLAALSTCSAQGTGNVNAQLGAVEKYFIPQALDFDTLALDLETVQFAPNLFNETTHFSGTTRQISEAVPVAGVTRNIDLVPVTQTSAQEGSGATFSVNHSGKNFLGNSPFSVISTPLNYVGKVRVTINLLTTDNAFADLTTLRLMFRMIAEAPAFGSSDHEIAFTSAVTTVVNGRKAFSLSGVWDLAELVDFEGDRVAFSGLSSIFLETDAAITIKQCYMQVSLLDFRPGLDDMAVVYRHYAFGQDVNFLCNSEAVCSYQFTVGNTFAQNVSARHWLVPTDHVSFQLIMLQQGVLREAIAGNAHAGSELANAGFFGSLWNGLKKVGKVLAPHLLSAAKEYVGNAGALGHHERGFAADDY